MLAKFRGRLEQWGVDADVKVYPGAGHAFNAHGSSLYHEAADEQSWDDAIAFLTAQLTAGSEVVEAARGGAHDEPLRVVGERGDRFLELLHDAGDLGVGVRVVGRPQDLVGAEHARR